MVWVREDEAEQSGEVLTMETGGHSEWCFTSHYSVTAAY